MKRRSSTQDDRPHRIELNAAQIDAELADPQLTSVSDEHLLAIKTALQEALDRQKKLLDVMYAIAYSDHPTSMRDYSYPVQEELRLAMRREAGAGGLGSRSFTKLMRRRGAPGRLRSTRDRPSEAWLRE